MNWITFLMTDEFFHCQPDYDGVRRGREDVQDVKPVLYWGVIPDGTNRKGLPVIRRYGKANRGVVKSIRFENDEMFDILSAGKSPQWTDGAQYWAACEVGI